MKGSGCGWEVQRTLNLKALDKQIPMCYGLNSKSINLRRIPAKRVSGSVRELNFPLGLKDSAYVRAWAERARHWV